MSYLKKLSVATTGAVVIALGTGVAEKATAQTLTFEGVGDNNPVGEFYNTGSNDFNISFPDAAAIGIVDSDAGGSGIFSNEPSGNTILSFTTPVVTLNAPVGLVNSLSFSYVSAFINSNPASVRVYDGLDGSGNVIASQTLPLTPQGDGDPTGGIYDFDFVDDATGPEPILPNPVTVPIPVGSIARSVQFDATSFNTPGSGGAIGFDNITVQAVPEPSSVLGLLTFGAFGATAMLKRRRRKCQN